MEASDPSGNRSIGPQERMAEILGTAIAIVTLTLPLITISYFSNNIHSDTLYPTTYSLPELRN